MIKAMLGIMTVNTAVLVMVLGVSVGITYALLLNSVIGYGFYVDRDNK